MAEKYTSRFPPCPAYDMEGFESWLEDMAKNGLILEKDPFFAGFASFRKTEPKAIRYRLQPAPRAAGIFAKKNSQQEAIDLAVEYGWTYLGDHSDFFIFSAEDPSVPELDTDPRVQAMALQTFRKRKRNGFCSQLLLIALYLGLILWAGPISFLLGPYLWLPLLLFLVSGISIWLSIKELKHLKLLQQKLALGVRPARSTDWRKRKTTYWVTTLLSGLLSVLLIVSYVGNRLFSWQDNRWQPRTEELPFATAEDLFPGSTFEADAPWIMDENDHVAIRSTWLADSQIIMNQNGAVWPENLDLYLRVEYYDLRAEWLAKALYRELLHAATLSKYYEPRTVTDLPTEQECAWQDVVSTCVLLQEADTVMLIQLSQYQEPGLPLNQWAAVFAESILP